MFRKAKLRRFTIAVDGQTRPGLFSSEPAAIAAFDLSDGELEAAMAATAGRAIGLAACALRDSRTTGAGGGGN